MRLILALHKFSYRALIFTMLPHLGISLSQKFFTWKTQLWVMYKVNFGFSIISFTKINFTHCLLLNPHGGRDLAVKCAHQLYLSRSRILVVVTKKNNPFSHVDHNRCWEVTSVWGPQDFFLYHLKSLSLIPLTPHVKHSLNPLSEAADV